jgi:hypothetical protein
MVRQVVMAKVWIELLLYIVTTGILTYLSEQHEWRAFALTAGLCFSMFIVLKYSESAQFNSWLQGLIGKEYELAEKCGKWGIAAIYNMQDPVEKAQRNIDGANIVMSGSTFCLSGSTGASYVDPSVHRHWDYVKKKLDDGCPFKVLLTNPFCESKQTRNKLNSVAVAVDPKLNLMILIQLREKYPNFEVRLTNEIYCSVFFSEHEMMYDPYHLGQVNERLENYFVAFRFMNFKPDHGSSYYTQLRRHFEYLWNYGKPLEAFIEENRKQLKGHVK